jgi:hypothetical protein
VDAEALKDAVARERAITRIRAVWNRTSSRHEGEATAARELALGLMERYGILPSELGRTYVAGPSSGDLAAYRQEHGLSEAVKGVQEPRRESEEVRYEFFWSTGTGQTLKVSEMEVAHLVNAVRWMRRHKATTQRKQRYFDSATAAMLEELRVRGVGDPDAQSTTIVILPRGSGNGTRGRRGRKQLAGG